MERSGRFAHLVDRFLESDDHPGLDWHDVEATFRTFLEDMDEHEGQQSDQDSHGKATSNSTSGAETKKAKT